MKKKKKQKKVRKTLDNSRSSDLVEGNEALHGGKNGNKKKKRNGFLLFCKSRVSLFLSLSFPFPFSSGGIYRKSKSRKRKTGQREIFFLGGGGGGRGVSV